MKLQTFYGKVWDNTHILTENVLLLVYNIPENLVGITGFFLIKNDNGIKFLLRYVET